MPILKKKQEVIGRPKGRKAKKIQSLLAWFGKAPGEKNEPTTEICLTPTSNANSNMGEERVEISSTTSGIFRTSVNPIKGVPRIFFEIDSLPTSGKRIFHLNGTSIFYLQMVPSGRLFVKMELSPGSELDFVWCHYLDNTIAVPFSNPDHHYATLDETTVPAYLHEHDGTSWELPSEDWVHCQDALVANNFIGKINQVGSVNQDEQGENNSTGRISLNESVIQDEQDANDSTRRMSQDGDRFVSHSP